MTTQASAARLFDYVYSALTDKDGRCRAEDMVSAGAAIVGERCIDAAGNFNPRKHTFVPGSRVFSETVNALLCGDDGNTALDHIPSSSVYGTMRDLLTGRGYAMEEFPVLDEIFKYYAANAGEKTQWGFVPLSVPSDNMPFIIPLRVAFETRKTVDRIMEPLGDDKYAALQASVLALVESLVAVEGVLDHRTGLLLAMQTINGMAKTAPMTDEAIAKVQQ